MGLQPFTAGEREYFFGREREQTIISSSLYAAPVTVLYGASGVGKTSVLAAGVVPGLDSASRTVPVYFSQWQDPKFATALKEKCANAVEAKLGKPLGLNLDLPLPDLLAAIGAAFDGAILVILDQFEEYFLYHPESEAPFDGELAAAINGIESESGFAISLRDDWLSRLDRFDARIPNLLSNTFRIDHLNMAAAEEAIRKPLDLYNQKLANGAPVAIEDELVRSILDEVRTGKLQSCEFGGAGQTEGQAREERIETPFLQLVMERLWNEEINERQSRVIRLSTFEELGKADRILQSHLAHVMDGLSEDERMICARIFRYLVTPNYKKIAQETSDLVSWAELSREQVWPVLLKLSDRRVLRRVSLPPRFEIFHDVLGRPILEWRAQYIQAQKQLVAEKEAALEAARQEDEARRQRELAEKAQLLANERQGRLEERARALRRTRWMLIAAAFLALLAVVLASMARRNWKRAGAEAQMEVAHGLISASSGNLDTNPERSVLLATYAESSLMRLDNNTLPASLRYDVRDLRNEARDALNRAVQTSWLRRTTPELGADGVWAISFTPDGKRMAAAEQGGTVRVWDVASNKQLATLRGGGYQVAMTALSPDGSLLVTADLHKQLRVWILASRRSISLPGLPESVSGAVFSETGVLLAVGGINGTVAVYDSRTGRANFSPKQFHKLSVTALAFSRDGTRLATGSADKTVKIWDSKIGRLFKTLQGHTLPIQAVAFSADGRRLASSSSDRTVKIWDSASGRPIETLSGPGNDVVSLCFSPSGARLATGNEDGRVAIWDVATGRQLLELLGHKGAVRSISFDPRGDHLLTGSWDRTVRYWNVPGVHRNAIEDVAFSARGDRVASASLDATAKLWDGDADRITRTIPEASKQPIFAAALSRDASLIATYDMAGHIEIHDTATGRLVRSWPAGSPSGLAFSLDGSRLASSGPANSVVVWDVATGRTLLTMSGGQVYVDGVAFSRDGKLVAAASLDWTARVWDASSGKQLRGLSGHHGQVEWVAFSPHGKRLATASADHTGIIWDLNTGRKIVLRGHTNVVDGIAFSYDGTRVATASFDRTARVWDARTGDELFRFTHPSGVEQVSFSPDGKRLATACDDGMVRVFILDDQELLRLVRRRTVRAWTQDECKEYLHQACPRDLAAPPASVSGSSRPR
ncbi:MAG: hypothetical protein ACRD3D_07855 [Terriglobia bacterium]